MFGRSFLVAPETEPMYVKGEGKKWRNPVEDFSQTGVKAVYLPAGSEWYDFWTGDKLSGGQTVDRKSPIDLIPVYVRAGSIVPWGPDVHYAAEKPWDNLEIRIYQGADGKFTLYEDEGDNYNYEHGAFSTIDFQWDDASKTMTISPRKGSFKGMLKKRKFLLTLVSSGKGTGAEASAKPDKTVSYSGKKTVVKL